MIAVQQENSNICEFQTNFKKHKMSGSRHDVLVSQGLSMHRWHIPHAHKLSRLWCCCIQAAAFAQAQIRTIGNAIRKLSSELYTKDVHFIMELVQVGEGTGAGGGPGRAVPMGCFKWGILCGEAWVPSCALCQGQKLYMQPLPHCPSAAVVSLCAPPPFTECGRQQLQLCCRPASAGAGDLICCGHLPQ